MFNDPKLKSAFIKAVKKYFEDNDLEGNEYDKVHGERKFKKSYFDTLDEELNNPKPEEEPKKKKGKK